jgi:hypothetical protein
LPAAGRVEAPGRWKPEAFVSIHHYLSTQRRAVKTGTIIQAISLGDRRGGVFKTTALADAKGTEIGSITGVSCLPTNVVVAAVDGTSAELESEGRTILGLEAPEATFLGGRTSRLDQVAESRLVNRYLVVLEDCRITEGRQGRGGCRKRLGSGGGGAGCDGECGWVRFQRENGCLIDISRQVSHMVLRETRASGCMRALRVAHLGTRNSSGRGRNRQTRACT